MKWTKTQTRFQCGDRVRLRKDSDLNFETEEARLDQTYEVEDVRWSPLYGDYVKLRGIVSDYAFNWIEFAR